MKRVATLIALAVCGGCAAQNKAARTCEPVPAELSLIGQPVYRDCEVDRRARPPARLPRMNYTPSGQQSCLSAVVEVVVDSTGRPLPATARVVRSTDPTFALAVLNSLAEMRYRPARKGGQPVAQLVTYSSAMMLASRTPSRPPC
jgi:hypothetical protein